MEIKIADRPGEDKKCLHIKSLPGKALKNFSYSQKLKWKAGNQVTMQYYLLKHSNLANVSLTIEAFDKQGKKKIQLTCFAGGDIWEHGNVGPERTAEEVALASRRPRKRF